MGRNSVKEVDKNEIFIGRRRHGRSFGELKRLWRSKREKKESYTF